MLLREAVSLFLPPSLFSSLPLSLSFSAILPLFLPLLICVCVSWGLMYTCVYTCMCSCSHPCVHIWKPNVNIDCPLLYFILPLKTGSFSEPRNHWLFSEYPQICPTNSGMTGIFFSWLFCRHWGSKLRFWCYAVNTLANDPSLHPLCLIIKSVLHWLLCIFI